MYRIGMSSCAFQFTEENFGKLQQSGIEAIEVSRRVDMLASLDYRELQTLSKRYGVALWSFHLPFVPFEDIDISSVDANVREDTIRLHTELIKRASEIGIDKFIVHPSGEPIAPEQRGERMNCAMESLRELADVAHRHGAVIAVEDLPRTCLGNTTDEMLHLISADDRLRVCLDTNHLLSENNLHFMDKLRDKIITTHISDYDFIDEKHWLPGEGKVDWEAMISKFEEIGYKGVWMYEVGLKCPRTLERERELTFDDFYRNANEIFSRKPITVLGTPRQNV